MGILFGGWAKEQKEDIRDAGGEEAYYRDLSESYRKSWIKEQEEMEKLCSRLTTFYQTLLEAEKQESLEGAEAAYWKIKFQKIVYGQ